MYRVHSAKYETFRFARYLMAGFNTVDRNGFRSSDIAMLTLKFPRTRELRASIHRCVSRCAVYACSLIIVLIATLVIIQMLHVAKSGATGAWHVVNRAGKHNRLPSGHVSDQNAGNEQRNSDVLRTVPADRELLDGCESLASSLTDFQLARIAGR